MKKLLLVWLGFLLISCVDKSNPEPIHSFSEKMDLLDSTRYNVGLLVIDGTYNSELTAPMDIFHHTIFRDSIKSMNVFTVSNTYSPVKTFEGLHIIPDFNFMDSLPQIDILVIPAGEHNLDSDLEDVSLVKFVKETARKCDFVLSHCDGAFLLAKTGLLDDKVSTTFPGDIDSYKEMYPHLEVAEDVLWVHDGKFITSAGGAKSFEASLYFCEFLYGKKVADELAQGMVIDWELDSLDYLVK